MYKKITTLLHNEIIFIQIFETAEIMEIIVANDIGKLIILIAMIGIISLRPNINKQILLSTIRFIKDTGRFNT